MLHKLIKGIAPVAAMALSIGLSGCNDMDIEINGEKGVPLSELDMSGDPPNSLVLAGPDRVILTEGDSLSIEVEGDSDVTDAVRFHLSDDALAVSRAKGEWKRGSTAIVHVTMPAPESIVIAGSGSVEAAAMAEEADIAIAGSGSANVSGLAATKMDVTIAGSGTLTASGSTGSLDLNVVGAGDADMAGLSVDDADVTIAGSGDATFASDGKVDASIMGSGSVRVIGSATCEISSMGSGTLRCEPADEAQEAEPATEE